MSRKKAILESRRGFSNRFSLLCSSRPQRSWPSCPTKPKDPHYVPRWKLAFGSIEPSGCLAEREGARRGSPAHPFRRVLSVWRPSPAFARARSAIRKGGCATRAGDKPLPPSHSAEGYMAASARVADVLHSYFFHASAAMIATRGARRLVSSWTASVYIYLPSPTLPFITFCTLPPPNAALGPIYLTRLWRRITPTARWPRPSFPQRARAARTSPPSGSSRTAGRPVRCLSSSLSLSLELSTEI